MEYQKFKDNLGYMRIKQNKAKQNNSVSVNVGLIPFLYPKHLFAVFK